MNFYVRSIDKRRKSCPICKAKVPEHENIWSLGIYRSAKWRTQFRFCKSCFATYTGDMRTFAHWQKTIPEVLGYRGETVPDWIRY